MKLISWKRYEPGYLNLYDLTVSHFTHTPWTNLVTEIYRGDLIWYNRETGHEATGEVDKSLCALRRKIEWGDYPELEKK